MGAGLDLNAEIQALTKRFAADLVSVVKIATLEAVAKTMTTMTSAGNEPSNGGSRVIDERDEESPSPEPPSATMSTEVISAADLDRVLFLIKARPHQHFRKIRDALGINAMHLRNALDVLLALGKIAKNGKGGAMTYRAV